jgi:hypothetical protein
MTHADAQRAIYIDFECRKGGKGQKPHPALLGVLIGEDEDRLEQLIVDERLKAASVARRERTAFVPLQDAVETLVGLAASGGTRIIGWSFFDRDRMIDARPDLEAEITARYINAIQIARPWRQRLYPWFTIEREDQFAPRHTLDKYARLAEYRAAKALDGAAPAKWIQHVLDQLEAKQGRYRQTTKQTKRDWDRLLDYNRHDLLALRHIVLRATRETEAWSAYKKTRFCVDDGPRRICFMAGSANKKLDALLERHDAKSWAFITAWNPGSIELPREQNEARQAQLRRAVAGYEVLSGEGIGEDPRWTPEESLLILNVSRGKAISLGRRFGQLAIVVGRRGEKSELRAISHDGRPYRGVQSRDPHRA